MKFLKMIPLIFIFLGISPFMNLSYAENKNPNEYKILSSTNKKLSISNVQDYLKKGDQQIENGDFEKAKQTYDKARNLAKQLADFIEISMDHLKAWMQESQTKWIKKGGSLLKFGHSQMLG